MSLVSEPRVIVQLLSWNQIHEVIPCIESFSAIDYKNYEILLIDNGSEDDTVTIVKRKFPRVKIIDNKENLGFCKANNIGFRYCLKKGFDYLLLMNTDTKVFPGLIRELVKVMQGDSRIGIAGAKNLLMEDPAYMWGQYGRVTWGPMLVTTIGRFEPDRKLGEPPKDVDWVICNGCMFSRAALETVGEFDETFWQCNEDVDWSYRARKAGFRVVYADTAAILHKGATSAGPDRKKIFSYGYFTARNAFLFAKKYASSFQMAKLFFWVWLGVCVRIIYVFLVLLKNSCTSAIDTARDFGGQRHFIRGIMDGLRGRLSMDWMIINRTDPAGAGRAHFHKNGLWDRFKRWSGL